MASFSGNLRYIDNTANIRINGATILLVQLQSYNSGGIVEGVAAAYNYFNGFLGKQNGDEITVQGECRDNRIFF